MNPKKPVFFLFLLGFLVCYLDLQAGEIKGPGLTIEEPSFDAGEVKEGLLIEHSFRFKNEGDTLLEIKRVKPD